MEKYHEQDSSTSSYPFSIKRLGDFLRRKKGPLEIGSSIFGTLVLGNGAFQIAGLTQNDLDIVLTDQGRPHIVRQAPVESDQDILATLEQPSIERGGDDGDGDDTLEQGNEQVSFEEHMQELIDTIPEETQAQLEAVGSTFVNQLTDISDTLPADIITTITSQIEGLAQQVQTAGLGPDSSFADIEAFASTIDPSSLTSSIDSLTLQLDNLCPLMDSLEQAVAIVESLPPETIQKMEKIIDQFEGDIPVMKGAISIFGFASRAIIAALMAVLWFGGFGSRLERKVKDGLDRTQYVGFLAFLLLMSSLHPATAVPIEKFLEPISHIPRLKDFFWPLLIGICLGYIGYGTQKLRGLIVVAFIVTFGGPYVYKHIERTGFRVSDVIENIQQIDNDDEYLEIQSISPKGKQRRKERKKQELREDTQKRKKRSWQ